jgi:hypothetical protein
VTDLDLTDRAGGAITEITAEKPGILISYARSDSSALAEELVAGLELAGFRPSASTRSSSSSRRQ